MGFIPRYDEDDVCGSLATQGAVCRLWRDVSRRRSLWLPVLESYMPLAVLRSPDGYTLLELDGGDPFKYVMQCGRQNIDPVVDYLLIFELWMDNEPVFGAYGSFELHPAEEEEEEDNDEDANTSVSVCFRDHQVISRTVFPRPGDESLEDILMRETPNWRARVSLRNRLNGKQASILHNFPDFSSSDITGPEDDGSYYVSSAPCELTHRPKAGGEAPDGPRTLTLHLAFKVVTEDDGRRGWKLFIPVEPNDDDEEGDEAPLTSPVMFFDHTWRNGVYHYLCCLID